MKRSHIIALVLIAVAMGAILTTLGDSTKYASFSEAFKDPGTIYHVIGKMNREKPQEFNPQLNPNVFVFYMVDREGTERKVILNQSKPQDFDRSEQIVIIGKATGKDADFHAKEVLMKCPSKYNNPREDIKTSASK